MQTTQTNSAIGMFHRTPHHEAVNQLPRVEQREIELGVKAVTVNWGFLKLLHKATR